MFSGEPFLKENDMDKRDVEEVEVTGEIRGARLGFFLGFNSNG